MVARRFGTLRKLGAVAGRAVVWTFAALRDGGSGYLSSRSYDHAASISFFALLSVAPFLVLVASAAGYVAVLLGPSSAVVEGTIGELAAALQDFSPVAGDTLRDALHMLIARRGQFGVVGAVVMLLGASMVFGAVEHATESVFRVHVRRRFLVSRGIFSVLLVACGVGVFVFHYGMTLADSILLAVQGQTLDEWMRESVLLDALLTYLPVPIGFLALLYAPGIVKVRLGSAVFGAVVFTVLWEMARTFYSWYVTSVARFGVLYGSLATPLLLILWTFYSANIYLFSISCVAAIERARSSASGRPFLNAPSDGGSGKPDETGHGTPASEAGPAPGSQS